MPRSRREWWEQDEAQESEDLRRGEEKRREEKRREERGGEERRSEERGGEERRGEERRGARRGEKRRKFDMERMFQVSPRRPLVSSLPTVKSSTPRTLEEATWREKWEKLYQETKLLKTNHQQALRDCEEARGRMLEKDQIIVSLQKQIDELKSQVIDYLNYILSLLLFYLLFSYHLP